MKHRPELDGVRGLAILLVVLYHAQWLPGGWIGVGVFFALSGYLITGNLLGEHTATGTVRLPWFYRRRVARLAPALVVALAVSAVVHRDPLGCLVVLAYVANFSMVLFPGVAAPTWTWSLSLEEQFYLLWPTALRRWLPRLGRHRLAAVLAFIAIVVAVARLAVSPHAGYVLLRGEEILLGSAAAFIPLRCGRLASGSAAAALAAFALAPLNPTTVVVAIPLSAVAAVCLVASASRWVVLSSAPMRHLGHISYALYLWNGVTDGLPTVPRILVSLAAAEASTWLLERPAQRWVRLLDRRRGDVTVATRPVPA